MPAIRPLAALALLSLSAATVAAIPEPDATRVDEWWANIATIASDANQGRLTGSPGYDRAADYVVSQFAHLRLIPAGTDGWFQPVELTEQRFDQASSKAYLEGPAGKIKLATPTDLYFRGSAPMPPSVDAPLVFAGYGLSIPEAGHDDFAGLDLKGKIVIVLSGGPAEISGALKSDARSRRAAILAERGAVGLIALTTAKQTEIKWDRQVALSGQPFMYPADASLREIATPFMNAFVGPDAAPKLFAGGEHDFAELSALADASKPLPVFALPQRLSATIVSSSRPVHAKNIVARLPGSDPVLSAQNVVLSAHLDGLGVGAPIKGDTIYNGAFDNAVGVSTLIETAKALTRFKKRPRRSILFVIVTGEEKGLLGSRYFAARPSVPAASLVADINLDMPLPIFAFTSVTPIGYEESSLGENAKMVAGSMGLPVVPDPKPDRNVFIRSDQYSFIRKGVPSLFLKYGFKLGTPEEKIEADWRANIYHSPQDDLNQPVMKAEGVKFTDYVIALARNVADDPNKPSWNADSYFKRFAK